MTIHEAPRLRRVQVLDVDPDLGARLSDEERRRARDACSAAVIDISPGVWSPPALVNDPAAIFALVVVDGMLCREASMGRETAIELLVAGDVMPVPVDTAGADDSVITPLITVTALSRVRVMALGTTFLRAGGLWPGLMTAVRDRLIVQRAHHTALSLALHLPRAVDRVLLTLWLLAERCGRVTPQGTLLPLEISHRALGQIIGAQRPTVSLALAELRQRDHLAITDDGHTVITPDGYDQLTKMTTTPALNDTPLGLSLLTPGPPTT